MSTTVLSKMIPTPSQLRKMPIDENRWYVEGYFHGLSSNRLCSMCKTQGRTQMFDIADCKAPPRSNLKWLPKKTNRYWTGFLDARGTKRCFECIREPQSPGAIGWVTLTRVYELSMTAAQELHNRMKSEHDDSRPRRRPWITYRELSAANEGLSPYELLSAWGRIIDSSPCY